MRTTRTHRSSLTRRGVATVALVAGLCGFGAARISHSAAPAAQPTVCWAERNLAMPDGVEHLCGTSVGYQTAWNRGVLLNRDGSLATLNEITGQTR